MHETALNQLRQLDRADLAVFLNAVNGAKNALKRDECGDWIIIGTRGTIRACNGTFSVFVAGRSRRHWYFVKKALAGFCRITHDGDDEGVLRLTRLPAGEEIVRLRHVIGLRQTGPAPAISISSRLQGQINAGDAPAAEGAASLAPTRARPLNRRKWPSCRPPAIGRMIARAAAA